MLADSTNVERPGHTRSERAVGASFDELFKGCKERIIVTTFASNVDRIQQIINVAARYGRKVAVTGRSMENSMRVATELGYTEIPQGILVDINHIKSLPREKSASSPLAARVRPCPPCSGLPFPPTSRWTSRRATG